MSSDEVFTYLYDNPKKEMEALLGNTQLQESMAYLLAFLESSAPSSVRLEMLISFGQKVITLSKEAENASVQRH